MDGIFMKNKLLLSVFLLISTYLFGEQTLETIYGNFTITEPVLCELLQSQAINRLKEIHQYGVVQYIHQTKYAYNRYTHSLGVCVLLRKYDASVNEQVAGLLHDASHTVFSHVGDHVYAQVKRKRIDQNDDAYQDNMHLWYLAQTDVLPILRRYGMSLEAINHKNGSFDMLERDLPDICADRLEYNLYGAYIEGWLDQKEIHNILQSLHYQNNNWFFDDAVQARKFAEVSIKLCEIIFASEWNIGSYEWAAKALLRAVELHVISMQDIHFGTDQIIFQRLRESSDEEIKQALAYMLQAKTLYQKSDAQDFDLCYMSKFRGIDPWVQTENGLQRLTSIDTSFADYFNTVKNSMKSRRYYKYRDVLF
jgi:HD superfamily phosphohydrolase